MPCESVSIANLAAAGSLAVGGQALKALSTQRGSVACTFN